MFALIEVVVTRVVCARVVVVAVRRSSEIASSREALFVSVAILTIIAESQSSVVFIVGASSAETSGSFARDVGTIAVRRARTAIGFNIDEATYFWYTIGSAARCRCEASHGKTSTANAAVTSGVGCAFVAIIAGNVVDVGVQTTVDWIARCLVADVAFLLCALKISDATATTTNAHVHCSANIFVIARIVVRECYNGA